MNKLTPAKILSLYFCIISCVFPLFFTNYYYNIQLSKSLFFMIATFLCLLGILILPLQSNTLSLTDTFSPGKSPENFSLALFCLSAFISALLSDYGRAAFTGEQGRYIGFFLILPMCISFWLFSTHAVDLRPCYPFFCIGSCLTALLGILQFVHIDLLGFSRHVPELLTGAYLSTLGQINTFSGYISMTLAFSIGLYCLNGKKILLLPSLIGYIALFAGNSDSGFFCIFAVIAVLPLLFQNTDSLFRLFEQLGLFGAACILGLLISPYGLIPYQGLPALFTRPLFFIPYIFIIGLLYVFFRLQKRKGRNIAPIKRIYIRLLIGLGILTLLLFFLTNLHIINISPLLLDDNWGSYRGFIWKKILEVYLDAPFLKKLFGYGPDTLKPLLLSLCREEMISVTGKIYDSAHNDFLQYLITTGLFGALSWLILWVNVIARSIKSRRPETLPWLSVLIAWFVQTMFIPTQPITAPLGFMIGGICVGLSKTVFVDKTPPKNSLF